MSTGIIAIVTQKFNTQTQARNTLATSSQRILNATETLQHIALHKFKPGSQLNRLHNISSAKRSHETVS